MQLSPWREGLEDKLFHLRVLDTEQMHKGCSRNKGQIAKRQSGIWFKLKLEFQTNYGTTVQTPGLTRHPLKNKVQTWL
jgi:hypothetical protein